MSMEKGSARGFSAVLGGTMVIGLKHPARRTARIPGTKKQGTRSPGTKFLSLAVFIDNSLSNFVLRTYKKSPVFPERDRGYISREVRERTEKKRKIYMAERKKRLNYYTDVGGGGGVKESFLVTFETFIEAKTVFLLPNQPGITALLIRLQLLLK
jgi:hypothetical protein